MKIGRNLTELAMEVDRQREAKRDFLAATDHITMEQMGNELRLGDDMILGIKPLAHDQLAAYTGIPTPYYKRMQKDEPELLMNNVNRWLHREPEKRMIRTLDGNARAFLSDKFRPLDNDALLEAALPPLMEMGVDIMSCEVTDSRLYLKVVDARIKNDVPTGRMMGDGSHIFFDTVSPALVLSNSEVGHGALRVETAVWTHLCTNLAVVSQRSTRKYHVGARADIGEEVYALLSDQTRLLTDAALWGQVRDVVKAAFDQAQFDAVCQTLGDASKEVITADPVKVVEITAKRFQMTQGEQSSVLRHLITGGSLTKYGLHAAVTRAAEDLVDYDRASHFEALGGKIIELPKNEWRQLAEAA